MKHQIINVAVGELLNCYGVVAEDVFGKNGAIILPAGVALPAECEIRPEMISNLLRHGVTHVRIKKQSQITSGEFRSALETVTPHINQFDPMLAKVTINQFATIYNNIDDKLLREHGIKSLVDFSSKIYPELNKTSQITLSMVAENMDNDWAYNHSFNVAIIAGYIAQKLFPMWTEFVENVILGGLFHDIGKAFLPDSMRKIDSLNPSELRILSHHQLIGESLLKDVGLYAGDVLGAVRSHHEKWNGTGTPDHLAKDVIPMSARIVAVANAFDIYAGKGTDVDKSRCDQALKYIIGITQTDFDKRVVRALLASIGLYPPGSVVELSDSRLGIVLETKERNLVCPRVMLFTDDKGQRIIPHEILNITRDGEIYIKNVFDDFSKRELDSYFPPESSQKVLARVKGV